MTTINITGYLCDPGIPLIEGLNVGAAWIQWPTTLARINEPPPRHDVNVETHEEGDVLTFFVRRDCAAGEELYLDYGRDYDRSSYGRNAA